MEGEANWRGRPSGHRSVVPLRLKQRRKLHCKISQQSQVSEVPRVGSDEGDDVTHTMTRGPGPLPLFDFNTWMVKMTENLSRHVP